MAILTDKQLMAQLSGWRRGRAVKEPFGIRTDLTYQGNRQIEVDGERFEVLDCRSDLEARQLLATSLPEGMNRVLLFRVDHRKVGEDVLGRLAKGELLNVDPRASLRELFKVTSIDPRIVRNTRLVETLVAAAASNGAINAPVGVLDMELAWSVLLRRPEIGESRPDLVTILRWSLNEDEWAPIRELEPEIRELFFSWVEERAGEATKFVQRAVDAGAAELLVPIGLALGPLYRENREAESVRAGAQARLEPYLGGCAIDSASALAWHLAAQTVVRRLPLKEKYETARRLDDLLGVLRVEALAPESDFSLRGLRLRIGEAAESLASFQRRKEYRGGGALLASFRALESHTLAEDPDVKDRIRRIEMAARLAIWLEQAADKTPYDGETGEAMEAYFRTISFADRARFALCEGDSCEELSRAYAQLGKKASSLRSAQQQAFADRLVAWNREGASGGLLAIERVMEEALRPVAQQGPVLLLVLDGMNCAVFQELLEDFQRKGWLPIQSQELPRPILSAIPSITEISRRGLFRGKIDSANTVTEQVAFRDHPALGSLSSKGKPILFLKGDLANAGSTHLSAKVRETIAGTSHRVVGLLLNVVDDQLSASDQLNVSWRVQAIRYLEPILEAAAQGQRTLMLLSDHGSIPEMNQTRCLDNGSDGGDRYRKGATLVDVENERELSGPRIRAATGSDSVVVAATENIRYAGKKGGYHGGVTDLEVVIPMAILQTSENPPEGWDLDDRQSPDWWNWTAILEGTDTASQRPVPRKTTRKKAATSSSAPDELPLFSSQQKSGEEKQVSEWIQRLLDSEVYAEQLSAMGRNAPKQAQVEAFLTTMEQRGGAALLSVIAGDLHLSALRVRGLLASLRRLFNIDGYQVIEEDRPSQTIRLDRALLLRQFGIST